MSNFPILNATPADLTGLRVVKFELPEPVSCPFKERAEYRQYVVISDDSNQVAAYFSSLTHARAWVKRTPAYMHYRIYRRLSP